MADRLGLAIIPGTGWPAREIQSVAREAEDAGFDAIFTAEVNNDALGTAQAHGRRHPPHPGGDVDRQYLPAPSATSAPREPP